MGLLLLEVAGDLYAPPGEEDRKLPNQAVFEELLVDAVPDDGWGQKGFRKDIDGRLAEPAKTLVEMARLPSSGNEKIPGGLAAAEGSNSYNLAGWAG